MSNFTYKHFNTIIPLWLVVLCATVSIITGCGPTQESRQRVVDVELAKREELTGCTATVIGAATIPDLYIIRCPTQTTTVASGSGKRGSIATVNNN